MNKQILFLLVLLFVTIASAGYGCPLDEQECRDHCILHVHNADGEDAVDGECGGFLWKTCQCIF